MDKLLKFFNEMWQCFMHGFFILIKKNTACTAEEMVRKTLYYRLSVIMAFMFVCSIAACVLLHMFGMLLIIPIVILGYGLYVGYLEYLSKHNNLIYLKVVCVNVRKEMKMSFKPVYTYYFQGFGENEGVSFSLNRTEELGFAQNIKYLFCFKQDEDSSIDNTSLVHYIELNQANTVSDQRTPKPHQNGTKKEALRKVQIARQKEILDGSRDAVYKPKTGNAMELDFSFPGGPKEE